MDDILKEHPRFIEATRDLKETILANLALIGEIPAPTYGEEHPIQLVSLGDWTSSSRPT